MRKITPTGTNEAEETTTNRMETACVDYCTICWSRVAAGTTVNRHLSILLRTVRNQANCLANVCPACGLFHELRSL